MLRQLLRPERWSLPIRRTNANFYPSPLSHIRYKYPFPLFRTRCVCTTNANFNTSPLFHISGTCTIRSLVTHVDELTAGVREYLQTCKPMVIAEDAHNCGGTSEAEPRIVDGNEVLGQRLLLQKRNEGLV